MKPQEHNSNYDWEDLEHKVLEVFDTTKPAEKYAVNEWKKEVDNIRNSEGNFGEQVAEFTNEDTINATVEYFKARVNVWKKIFEHHLACQIRDQHLKNITFQLSNSEGYFVNVENGEKLIPELLAVFRVDEKKIYKQVIEATKARALAEIDEDTEQPHWPSYPGIEISSFAADINELIEEHGISVCERILQICNDAETAKYFIKNEETPKPLLFLADLVLKFKPSLPVSLNTNKVGF